MRGKASCCTRQTRHYCSNSGLWVQVKSSLLLVAVRAVPMVGAFVWVGKASGEVLDRTDRGSIATIPTCPSLALARCGVRVVMDQGTTAAVAGG